LLAGSFDFLFFVTGVYSCPASSPHRPQRNETITRSTDFKKRWSRTFYFL